jgi:glycosyltransferase involved in cell wall biosynthesis
MPSFNSESYIGEAIESVLTQTYQDFELLAVDDGSTDQTVAITKRYARLDGRIRVLLREHTGIVGALQDGLAEARGRLVARMDADDVALPERFAKQVLFLSQNEDHVLIGTRVRLIDPHGSAICDFPHQITHEEVDSAHMGLQWAIVHPTVMVSAEALEIVGGYRLPYESLEDLDLFLRLAEIGRVANLPEVLLHYRQHFKSMCFVQSHRQNAVREVLYREAYERRGLPLNRSANEFQAPARSKGATFQRWAWMALEAGNIATARKLALSVIRQQPLDADSWRLMYCALRGH